MTNKSTVSSEIEAIVKEVLIYSENKNVFPYKLSRMITQSILKRVKELDRYGSDAFGGISLQTYGGGNYNKRDELLKLFGGEDG